MGEALIPEMLTHWRSWPSLSGLGVDPLLSSSLTEFPVQNNQIA